MILMIIIAGAGLVGLLALHEFGHFIVAKKFGVKVEEFGIGLPPRLFGKKIGETIYSINLIPLGAFVKLYGEEAGGKDDPRSFSEKPVWQRSLIILAGVISFWIISAILLSFIFAIGVPVAVNDADEGLINPRVQILAVGKDVPAEAAGIQIGDIIKKMESGSGEIKVDKVIQVQEFTKISEGEEIILTIKRGKETFEVSLVPRVDYPENEGAMGVALARTMIKKYPWHKAILEGVIETGRITVAAVQGWKEIISSLAGGEGMPAGAEVVGPVGIFRIFIQMETLGAVYFLRFLAIVSIFLALFNILPIPALDGGRFLFLIIEGIRGKPISPSFEGKVTTVCFLFLIVLIILVTIKDLINLF